MLDKSIIILTSAHLRHQYFKLKLSNSDGINVIKCYCDIVEPAGSKNIKNKTIEDLHFDSRRQVEEDFFQDYVTSTTDNSNSEFIPRGDINKDNKVQEIIDLDPDLIITYGCCIIKPALIEQFKGRIINVHLGLSPYYYGSGTNFFPFVNKELSAVGCTFMYMDEGIDTGKIIHQIRADIDPNDSIHQVGNRLIKKMTNIFAKIICNFENLKDKKPASDIVGVTYKKKDCTEDTIKEAYQNLTDGLCTEYLMNKKLLDKKFPLVEQVLLC